MMSNLEGLLENKRKEMEEQALDREEIRHFMEQAQIIKIEQVP